MDIWNKIRSEHTPFLVIGIGDLGAAASLIGWGIYWKERAQTVFGAVIAGSGIMVGFLTILLGLAALAFLRRDLTSLSPGRYAFSVMALALLSAPSWIALLWIVAEWFGKFGR